MQLVTPQHWTTQCVRARIGGSGDPQHNLAQSLCSSSQGGQSRRPPGGCLMHWRTLLSISITSICYLYVAERGVKQW